MSGHTQGPWRVVSGAVWFTGPEQEKIVCTPAIERTVMADVAIDDLSAAANANLIAAAPDLLAALIEYQRANRLHTDADEKLHALAEAAIAKAEGK